MSLMVNKKDGSGRILGVGHTEDDNIPECMEEITCTTCNGSGIESYRCWESPEVECADCFGTGTIIVRELKSYEKATGSVK